MTFTDTRGSYPDTASFNIVGSQLMCLPSGSSPHTPTERKAAGTAQWDRLAQATPHMCLGHPEGLEIMPGRWLPAERPSQLNPEQLN